MFSISDTKLFCLALVASSLALTATGAGAQDDTNSKVSIALLPVVVHTAEDPEYLRAGLTDMMVSRLEQAGLFEVTRVSDVGVATIHLSEALEAGRAAGAEFVLFGSFTRFGEGASLDMQCASTLGGETETLREIFVHSGSIGDVIPDLEELVGKVSRFAVDDFETRVVGTGAGAAPRARPSESKLRRRVETLERETRELKHEVDDRIKKLQAPPPTEQR
ncbi:MAG: hypothetical protein VX246_07570 [Myxococcota bacterium]|nr:hypothetical protein [Myxococcota bacterium]